jgi:hypothetical protein
MFAVENSMSEDTIDDWVSLLIKNAVFPCSCRETLWAKQVNEITSALVVLTKVHTWV